MMTMTLLTMTMAMAMIEEPNLPRQVPLQLELQLCTDLVLFPERKSSKGKSSNFKKIVNDEIFVAVDEEN